ncbi:MAG: elongation factor P hydroxylase [Immundisolibacteraceae bacterium]|nr:elongation factor P hydroxylase [Immundisolibacteraceae bacterium]
MPVTHDPEHLIGLFNKLFLGTFNCRLVRGGEEPLYRPAVGQGDHHQLRFAHGFFASALHEIAHWCIAGTERRQQQDFGYWYEPKRDQLRQTEFERMEARPQGLEWVFSDAAGFVFQPSIDNLELDADPAPFLRQVAQARQDWLNQGLPAQAVIFRQALAGFYQT